MLRAKREDVVAEIRVIDGMLTQAKHALEHDQIMATAGWMAQLSHHASSVADWASEVAEETLRRSLRD